MSWTWDIDKAKANRAKHGLSFETAVLVFDDPLHASKLDPHPDGDRWHTIGLVGSVLLLVVHTWPEAIEEGELVGRIISARKATAHERKAYEEGSF
ncbi:MAG TPA: BrnT family toxin [Bradyrhizobium sp.]|nr:BrnT family toxin [Bradyrhizobium sp.]